MLYDRKYMPLYVNDMMKENRRLKDMYVEYGRLSNDIQHPYNKAIIDINIEKKELDKEKEELDKIKNVSLDDLKI
jgi:hypothetical protein